MPDENKPEQQKTEPFSPAPAEKKVPLSWVILGIAAVIIMWALSSWWFR